MNTQQNLADLLGRILISGGFLFLVARGAGDWSLDARRELQVVPGKGRS